jgi:poly [ADP-ribose] polymerase
VERQKFILTDVKENCNKFWAFEHDGSKITYRWGRVGHAEQAKTMNFTQSDLDKKIREKTKKGYKQIETLDAVTVKPAVHNVKEAAFSQLASGDKTLTELIERLVAANRHELLAASGGQIQVNLQTGAVSTPLGIITKSSIKTARDILSRLAPHVQGGDFEDPAFIENLQEYLQLVPQRVGHARGWHRYVITDDAAIQKQESLLDQLEASADFAMSSTNVPELGVTPKLFETKIKETSVPLWLEHMFESSRNRVHTSNNLKIARVFDVDHGPMNKAFAEDGEKIGNVKLLWHGTRTFNVLSILKGGLIIPKSGGSFQVTGRMFGNGVYFSDQSTKSLNYAQGYWDGGTRDDRCFMFLASVAMGKTLEPKTRPSVLPAPGYDSTFVRGGTCSVMNNEMIVYRTSQVDLRYLVEFERR